MRFIEGVFENIDYMEKYFLNCWMLNYFNLVLIIVEVVRRLRFNFRVINICDMLIGMEYNIVRIVGFKFCKYMDIRYFGLNYFGWYILIKDKKGNEFLLKLVEYIKEYGFINGEEGMKNDKKDSWFEINLFIKEIVKIDLIIILSSYLKYYLFLDYVVNYFDVNYICVNEVIDGREKEVFGLCVLIEK